MNDPYPRAKNFRMPAEWHLHEATLLAWPHNRETWPQNLAAAQHEFANLVRAILEDEPVILLASSDLHEKIRRFFPDSSNHELSLLDIPTNDAWIRDYGPTFVTNGQSILAIDWRYNAWGNKYPPYHDDQQLVTRLQGHAFDFGIFESRICLEGGALEIDDNAVAMCTRSCVLDPNRNRGIALERIEEEIKQCLGAKTVLWLPGEAIEGDDTDGHIDQFARFAPGRRILHATSSSTDPQNEALRRNFEELRCRIESEHLNYDLVPLPVPAPVVAQGKRLPASYCNFYITNRQVIMPLFGQHQDETALAVLELSFPNRKVIGLPSAELSVGLGSFHCLTQQVPLVNQEGPVVEPSDFRSKLID